MENNGFSYLFFLSISLLFVENPYKDSLKKVKSLGFL